MDASLRILIIEDSEDDAALMLRSLRRAGFALSERRVDTLAALSAALTENEWDLVLSDFNLPGFTARGALEEVRKRSQEIPFIIVSGAIGEELAAEMIRAGANDVINKSHLVRLAPAIERELRESKIRKDKKKADEERHELLEELKRAVAVRDEFLAIASHELKTPITSLKLQAHILNRSLQKLGPGPKYNQQVVKFADISIRQIERMTRLVDEMLSMTRMMSQGLSIHCDDMEMRHLVQKVLEHFAEQIRESGSQVVLLDGDPVRGRWDSFRMEQVIENLLSNALKYGSGKPIEIHIRKEGDHAILMISDHGIGIAPEDQKRIFSRFERAVSYTNISGLGLGLYIVSEIVHAHGGEIAVQSEYGQGSTFVVRLPLVASERPAISQSKSA
ncbi:MAG: ATP-binding protein [Bdellovibrionia bacterium]